MFTLAIIPYWHPRDISIYNDSFCQIFLQNIGCYYTYFHNIELRNSKEERLPTSEKELTKWWKNEEKETEIHDKLREERDTRQVEGRERERARSYYPQYDVVLSSLPPVVIAFAAASSYSYFSSFLSLSFPLFFHE